MRESQKSDDPVNNDAWGVSDALVLQGLNGLANEMASPFTVESRPASSGPAEKAGPSDEAEFHEIDDPENEDFSAAAPGPQRMEGFRSARELRAAQERFAAQRRSAWRRREGITQALGLKATPRGTTPANFTAPEAPSAPGQTHSQSAPADQRDPWPADKDSAPPSPVNRMASSEYRSESHPQTERKPVESAASKQTASPPRQQHRSPSPWRPTQNAASASPARAPQSTLSQDKSTRPNEATPAPEKKVIQPAPRILRSTAPHVPASLEETKPASSRNLMPQMETVVRRKRTTSSFLPSVLTSLLLTSLIWGGLLYGFWHYGGDELLGERIQEETAPLMARQKDDLSDVRARLSIDMQALQDRHEQFVRMNALEAAIHAENSRPKFDDLLKLGRNLATGSSEEDFFQQTKKRIEAAYRNRLAQHPGLDVEGHFPQLGVSQETSLDKSTLVDFLTKTDKSGWDRARSAVLLRKFEDDDIVIASLIETMRDDQDLQAALAAWESLVELTDYVPGSKGFSPGDFNRWWSTR